MRLAEYVGQERVKALLKPEIEAARRGQGRHMLFEGGYGEGKTALAGAVASELNYQPVLLPNAKGMTAKRVQEFLHGLSIDGYDKGGYPSTASAKRYLIVVDEAHTMPEPEAWYEPMSSRHIVVNGGLSWVPIFMLILATNQPQVLPNALLSRLVRFRLAGYSTEELAKIAALHNRGCSKEILAAAAQRARGIPRLAVELARSASNFGGLDYFETAGIDPSGLTELDRAYLEALGAYTSPVGVQTLASRLGSDVETLRGVVEPFLVRLGLIEITERGRKLAEMGRGSLTASLEAEGLLR